MRLFWPTLGALAILAVSAFVVGRMNRDLLRARAYGEFLLRMVPVLSTAVFVAGLPFVVSLASADNYGPTLLVYLAGAAVLTALASRAVSPEERRAGAAFGASEPEKAAEIYEDLVSRRPLPRYHSALAASLDASGRPEEALQHADLAVKMDPKLGIAYYNRASALAALGRTKSAREDLQAVFQSDAGRRLRRAAEEALQMLEKG